MRHCVKGDRARAGERALYVGLRCIDSLKILTYAPSSRSARSDCTSFSATRVTKEESHEDIAARRRGWARKCRRPHRRASSASSDAGEPSALPPGQQLLEPKLLFRKLRCPRPRWSSTWPAAMSDARAHVMACSDPPPLDGGSSAAVVAVGGSCRAALRARRFEDGVYAALAHPHDAAGHWLDELRELSPTTSGARSARPASTTSAVAHDARLRRAPRSAAELGKQVVVRARAGWAPPTLSMRSQDLPHRRPGPSRRRRCEGRASEAPLLRSPRCASNMLGLSEGRQCARVCSCASRPIACWPRPTAVSLSPQPRRGKPNEPANVVHAVEALAGTARTRTVSHRTRTPQLPSPMSRVRPEPGLGRVSSSTRT